MTSPFNPSTLIPYRKEQRWGYCDANKTIMIECAFEHAHWFKEGLALVRNNSKFGFINEKGLLIAPFLYEDAGQFSEGLAAVKSNSKWGFIDFTGKVVIPFQYDRAWDFMNGLSRVMLNNRYGFINHTGGSKVGFIYDYADDFSEGLSMVNLNGKIGFIDNRGTNVIPCIYDFADSFSEGLAWVGIQEFGSPTKYGFINKSGDIVIDIIYRNAERFQEGLARVKIENKKYPIKNPHWGIGVSLTKNSPHTTIFIDKFGNEILRLEDELKNAFHKVLSNVTNGLIIVGDEYCQKYFDKHGNNALSFHNKYESVSPFYNNLAKVKGNKKIILEDDYEIKYGYINNMGEEIIACKYDVAGDFSKGFAYARYDNKDGIEEGYINTCGIEYWEGIGRKYSQ